MNKFLKLGLISGATLTLDQLSKWLIFSYAPTTLVIKKVTNTGAAFGLFQNSAIILGIIAIIATAYIIYFAKKSQNNFILPLALILGGAIGNLIDRIFLGYVRDFISISIWPVFNLADSAICIGAIYLIYLSIKKKN